MSSRKRIQRKNPWQPTPASDILQSRPFSNGKKARESKLPTTNDILQTRPFSPRNNDVSSPKDTRSFEEKMIGAEFGYNGVSMPAFAPSEPPSVQREEDVEENSQEQAEGGTSAANISVFAPSAPPENLILSPFSLRQTGGWGQEETIQREEVAEEEVEEPQEVGIQKQQLEAPPDDGIVQRLCAECEGELAEDEEKTPIQAKLTVGEPGDKYEQEADAVAAQVVEKINSPPPQESVQRQSELGKSPGNDELMAQLPALPSLIPGAVLSRIGGRVSTKVLWQTFWKVVIKRFGIRGAAAAALSLADGPLPIGELISIGIAIATLWDLFHLWSELWDQAATEAVNNSQAVTPSEEEDDTRDKPIPQDEDENSRYLYAFGNKTNPRPPREQKDIPVDREGYVNGQPERGEIWSQGASTFGDPKLAPIKGHYHRIPRNAPIPPLAVMADGRDVGGPHGATHHTIFPIERMLFLTFSQLFLSLPWIYAGNKK